MKGMKLQIDTLREQIQQQLLKRNKILIDEEHETKESYDLKYYALSQKTLHLSGMLLNLCDVEYATKVAFDKLLQRIKDANKQRPIDEDEEEDNYYENYHEIRKSENIELTKYLNNRQPIQLLGKQTDEGKRELYRYLANAENKEKDNQDFLNSIQKVKFNYGKSKTKIEIETQEKGMQTQTAKSNKQPIIAPGQDQNESARGSQVKKPCYFCEKKFKLLAKGQEIQKLSDANLGEQIRQEQKDDKQEENTVRWEEQSSQSLSKQPNTISKEKSENIRPKKLVTKRKNSSRKGKNILQKDIQKEENDVQLRNKENQTIFQNQEHSKATNKKMKKVRSSNNTLPHQAINKDYNKKKMEEQEVKGPQGTSQTQFHEVESSQGKKSKNNKKKERKIAGNNTFQSQKSTNQLNQGSSRISNASVKTEHKNHLNNGKRLISEPLNQPSQESLRGRKSSQQRFNLYPLSKIEEENQTFIKTGEAYFKNSKDTSKIKSDETLRQQQSSTKQKTEESNSNSQFSNDQKLYPAWNKLYKQQGSTKSSKLPEIKQANKTFYNMKTNGNSALNQHPKLPNYNTQHFSHKQNSNPYLSSKVSKHKSKQDKKSMSSSCYQNLSAMDHDKLVEQLKKNPFHSEIHDKLEKFLAQSNLTKEQILDKEAELLKILQEIQQKQMSPNSNTFYGKNSKYTKSLKNNHVLILQHYVRMAEQVHRRGCTEGNCRHLEKFYGFLNRNQKKNNKQTLKLSTYHIDSNKIGF